MEIAAGNTSILLRVQTTDDAAVEPAETFTLSTGYVSGTVLNQTGQAVEVVAITMLVYLVISLATSSIMNLYNRRMALVER